MKPEKGNRAGLQGEVTLSFAKPMEGQPSSGSAAERNHLTVPLSRDEIGLHHWVSRAAKLRLHHYLRAALDEKARRVVADLASRGKKLPPWVAKLLDHD